MNPAIVTAQRPADVAREVEQMAKRGCSHFLIRRLAHGGMLDLERLGAARYAAGVQAEVALEDEVPVFAFSR